MKSTVIAIVLVLTLAVVGRAQRRPNGSSGDGPSGGGSDGAGIIQGQVVLPSGHPINNSVRVTLSPQGRSLATGTVSYTDNEGGFVFTSLTNGSYTLEVTGDPLLYKAVTQTVHLAPNQKLILKIGLEEKEKTVTEKPAAAVVSAPEANSNSRVPSDARKEFEDAAALATQGDHAGAIDHLRRAIDIYPEYLEAINNLGVQYLLLKDLPNAAEQFELAVGLAPRAYNPRLNLGVVRVRQRRFEEAREHLSKAIGIDSTQPQPHLYLGIAAMETDDLATAEQEIFRSVELSTQAQPGPRFFLAQVYLKKGEREPAVRELTAYLAAAPNGEYANQARQWLDQLKQ